MKDEDFELLGVLIYDGLTDRRTDICDCRVAFATENDVRLHSGLMSDLNAFWIIKFFQNLFSKVQKYFLRISTVYF